MNILHYSEDITYLQILEPYKLVSLMSSCNYRLYLDGKGVEVDLQECVDFYLERFSSFRKFSVSNFLLFQISPNTSSYYFFPIHLQ